MNRLLASLSSLTLFAVAASAQCFSVASPGVFVGQGDDTLFPTHYALGFTFPMAGSSGAGTWTHCQVCTNGFLVLTDGVTAPNGAPSSTNYGSAASLVGATGNCPRIAPYWGDLDGLGFGNGVYIDSTSNPGVSCKISWINVVDYGTTAQKTFQVELFASGQIKLSYASGMNVNGGSAKVVGLSCSNGVIVPSASDFVPGPASQASGSMFQTFATGTFDLGGRSLTFVPAGAGWQESVTCAVLAASHTNYGTSCYAISNSFYQTFATAALASPALSNTAITMTPGPGGGYAVTNGGSLLPVGSIQAVPTVVAVGDDVSQTVPFTTGSFPGSTGLSICSNGFVSLAAGNGSGYNATAATLLADPQTSFRSWHDLNPTIAGSGQIKYEESAAAVVVTYDGVWDFAGTSAADANTIQIQLYPSGVVVIAWGTLSPLGASGIGYVVGYSPGGPSNDPGSINLASALPITVSNLNVTPLSLSASPAPVSTAASGTLVTFTMSNIPETLPTSGVYLGVTVLSLTPNSAGTSLAYMGMPGCTFWVGGLDVSLSFVGGTSTQTTQMQVPAGVAYGMQFYATSAALVVPNSLPNGQNAYGAVTSNGVASFVSSF